MDLSTNRPMMEEMKQGRWPSFVKEIEKAGSSVNKEVCDTLLDLLEES